MNKLLLFLVLLMPATLAFSQPAIPVNLQPGAVIALPAGAAPSALAIADYNQDNRPDIAVCQRGLSSVGVYLQTTGGSFPNPAVGTYATGTGPSALVAVPLGYVPGRATADLVAISGPSSTYTLLTNNTNGTGTFTPVVNTGSNNDFGFSNLSVNPQVIAQDLDNNGFVDFVFLYDAPSPITINDGVYWQRLTSPTQISSSYQSFFRPGYRPSSFTMDDLDRDGRLDLVMTSSSSNEFTVVYSAYSGSSAPLWNNAVNVRQSSSGVGPISVATGDLNHDLTPDLAIAHEGSSDITLFLNLRNGQFGAPASYPLSGVPRQVLLKDLNNDGLPEMLVLTANNQLQIFQHTGATGVSRYGAPITLATGTNPVTMQVVDVDGDFKTDVVVGCAGDNTVRVFLNRPGALSTRMARLTGVDVYPNPAREQFTIRRTATLRGSLTATLLDALGREVRRTEISASATTMPVVDLPRGVYVLHLAGAAGVMNQRVVVE